MSATLQGEASCALKLKWPWGPAKQLNSYVSRRQILLLAGVLGKSSLPQLMSFYQSMLFLPRLALTCALWSTGKSQCGLFGGPSPNLSAQENPISLDGAWKPLPPVSLPSAAWPGTLQNKKEPYREVLGYVTGWGWGHGVCSRREAEARKEEAKEIREPVYLTQYGSIRLWRRDK